MTKSTSRRRVRRVFLGCAISASVLGLQACGGGGGEATSAAAAPAAVDTTAPQVTIDSPLSAALNTGSELRIRGSVSDNVGVQETIVRVDSEVVWRGAGGSFDVRHVLRTDTYKGTHHVDVTAYDKAGRSTTVRRKVFSLDAGAPAFERVLTLPETGGGHNHILAVDGSQAVVSAGSSSRAYAFGFSSSGEALVVNGGEIGLELSMADGWIVSALSSEALGAWLPFAWGRDGARVDLIEAGAKPGSQVITSNGWAAWVDERAAARHVLRRLDGTQQHVVEVGRLDGTDVGRQILLPREGGMHYYHSVGGTWHVYDSVTRQSVPAGVSRELTSDGRRLVWSVAYSGQLMAGTTGPDGSVRTTETLTTVRNGVYYAADGVIAWTEVGADGVRLMKVNDAAGTVVIPDVVAITSVGGGGVAYKQGERLMLWTRSGGSRFLHHDTNAIVKLTRGYAWFMPGIEHDAGALYRFAL